VGGGVRRDRIGNGLVEPQLCELPQSGTDGGPILRRVIHDAGASGIDVLIISRRGTPAAEALDSSAAKES
jgi:hypothetical protein